MDEFIEDLRCQNNEKISTSLNAFCHAHARTMKFPELNGNNVRCDIWRLLYEKLSNGNSIDIHEKCLATLRILSRDKTDLDNLITDDRLNIIINKANLDTPVMSYTNVTLEALKLICNLIYNSASVQIQIAKTSCLSILMKRLSTYNDTTPCDIKLFDVRILFLITAFNITSRNFLKYELNAHNCLINMLENSSNQRDHDKAERKNIEISCEILKALFNLYIDCDDLTDDEKENCKKLVLILQRLLIANKSDKKDELQNHVINMLTVIPSNCCGSIIEPAVDIEQEINREIYCNTNMTAISELLTFLDQRLNNQCNISENILPVLTALLKLITHERLIRKYCRQKVLPPLKDVMRRPEEGTTLRAKLCQLLISPLTELKNLVAEFLFVLCKENVNRMIKYTGYGNAAGMFANKGLLGCKQPENNYSSDSGESDTEEYSKYKEDINPITGCYEKPKASPLAGMTEEQKEYEAMRLVNLVNKLTNDGVVRPCTIGEDGKPKPVEHVLQLQDGFRHGLRINQDSDSE